jgi:translation elongation factor EF-1beta
VAFLFSNKKIYHLEATGQTKPVAFGLMMIKIKVRQESAIRRRRNDAKHND